MNILSLNFDCLVEILNYLPPRDLLSMASANQKFSKVLPMCQLKSVTILDDRVVKFSREEWEFLFKNLGGSISKLSSTGIKHLDIICKYCVNLKDLTLIVSLNSFLFTEKIKEADFINLFKRLECLNLTSQCADIKIERLFNEPFLKMKKLTITESRPFDCGVIKAPNLEEICIKGYHVSNFQKFMQGVPKLTDLELSFKYPKGSSCFNNLSLQLPLLKRLSLSIHDTESSKICFDDAWDFGDLNFLQELELTVGQTDIVRNPFDAILKKLCKQDQLTCLSLTNIPLEIETLQTLSKMKNLSNIKIVCDKVGNEEVKALYLNNFTEITLGNLNVKDPEVFMSLPKQSENLKKFTYFGIVKMKDNKVKQMIEENPNIVIQGPIPKMKCSSSSQYFEDEMCISSKRICIGTPSP